MGKVFFAGFGDLDSWKKIPDLQESCKKMLTKI